ncbi:MAG TPA: PKD domain-containing protein [Gemmatimonadales bacterium]|nr:PKD domain-containing protein [Gemmatimonadales bacterium]
MNMRSIGRLAVAAGTLVLATACGDGGGTTPPENAAPVANFTVPACTINVACAFVSTSTDDAQVAGWSWDFDGDGTPDATTESASFTYTEAGTFDVSLTVHDVENLSHTKTSPITIAPADPGDPVNSPPAAAFTHTCDALDCSFASTSTDAAPGTITTYAWDFGDGETSALSSPSHSYTASAPKDFTVTLTVTDNDGATDAESQTVTVTPAPAPNTPPTASFTHDCAGLNCTFTSTSTDAAPGTIATFAWDFGDGGTATVSNPAHNYNVATSTDIMVTLTVTDDEGATDVESQTITVTPPPPPPPGVEGCTTSGTRVDCLLDIASRSTIKLKLTGLSCDLAGQRITVPGGDQVFLNVCSRVVGDSTRIFGGPMDTAVIFEPGSQARLRFTQGTAGAGEPALAAPAAQLTGSFPNWTISFEDGATPGEPGEPDFGDVVLQVTAVPSP